MARTAATTRAQKSASTRSRIGREALRLFVEKGIAATTTRDIADATGMSEGSLYRHWAGKEELAWELFRDSYADLARELRTFTRDDGLSTAGAIEAIVRYLCGTFDDDPYRFHYLLTTQHEFAHRIVGRMESPIEELDTFLDAAMRAGAIARCDRSVAISLLIGPILRAASFITHGRLKRPLSRWESSFVAAAVSAFGFGEVPAR